MTRHTERSACGTVELPDNPDTTVPFTAASRTLGTSPAMMSKGFVYQNLRFLGTLGSCCVLKAGSGLRV
jgi:hypothetical protein